MEIHSPAYSRSAATHDESIERLLEFARSGEEVEILNRQVPLARIVSPAEENGDAEEASLITSGQISLPKRKFDEQHFWSIGARIPYCADLTKTIQRAMDAERRNPDGGTLRSLCAQPGPRRSKGPSRHRLVA